MNSNQGFKMEDFLKIDELCKILKVKKSYIYNLTFSKQIPFYKIGNLLRFKHSEIEKWLSQRKIDECNNCIDY